MEKIVTDKLKLINRERDDMDLKANARSEVEKTSSIDDTMALVAAVSNGKGLRGIPMQTMPPGMYRLYIYNYFASFIILWVHPICPNKKIRQWAGDEAIKLVLIGGIQ